MRPAASFRPILYLCFAAGSAASLAVGVSPWLLPAPLLLLLLCGRRPALRWWACAPVFVLGLCLGTLRTPEAPGGGLLAVVAAGNAPSFQWVRGRVVAAEPWIDGCRADIAADTYLDGDRWRPADCIVRAYLPVPAPLPGSTIEASLRLAVPRGRDNPGQFDARAHLRREGIALTAAARAPELVRITGPARWNPVGRYARALEGRLLEDGGRSGGALLAILLGERGLMDPAQVDALSASGLYHLVALSGFNVGLLLLALALMCHSLGIHPRSRDVSALVLLVAYGALVASQPSLGRALIMACVFLVAQLLARPQGGLLAWAVSAALLLAWDPGWILDAGFQLTFAATLGILLLWDAYPRWVPRTGLVGGLIRLHWVGFAALLATLPLVLLTFQRVSLLGWLATPLASLPLMAVQTLGTAYIFGLAFVPGVHEVLGWMLDGLTRLFLLLPSWLGEGRWGTVFVPRPSWGWVGLYAAAFVLLCIPGRARRAGWVLAAFSALGAALYPTLFRPDASPSLAVLDVGQASCQVLRWGRHTLLVDAGNGTFRGPTTARAVIEPYLAATGVGCIDGVFLTHWDEDHSGSAPDLLVDLPVGFLAYPATDRPHEGTPERIGEICRHRGIRTIPLRRGDRLLLDGLKLDVLNPPMAEPEPDENDRSLVLRALVGRLAVLFTGDLERPGERALVRAGEPAPTFALVAPHHGSSTSSCPEFVARVSPRLALFSVGRGNRFGHPSAEVLERYRSLGARLARTDSDGALLLQGRSGRLLWRMRDGDWIDEERAEP